jgi:hypothetical protein
MNLLLCFDEQLIEGYHRYRFLSRVAGSTLKTVYGSPRFDPEKKERRIELRRRGIPAGITPPPFSGV